MSTFRFPQVSFLRLVAKALPEGYSLHHYLMDQFEISESAAFKRIRGAAELKSHEIAHLVAAYPTCLEKLLAQSEDLDHYAMSQTSYFSDEDELWTYLKRIHALFSRAKEEGAHLYYTALDFPLFHFLAEADILNYKYAFWTNRILVEGISPLRANTLRLAREIYELYRGCASTEIWSPRIVQRQSEQLRAMVKAGHLGEAQVLALEQAYARQQAQSLKDLRREEKEAGIAYRVYRAPYNNLSNGGVLLFPEGESIYMGSFSNAQFLRSSSKAVVDKFRADFDALRALSEPMY